MSHTPSQTPIGASGIPGPRFDYAEVLYRLALDGLDARARRLWGLVREQATEAALAAHDDRRLASILAEHQTRSQEFFSSAAGRWDRLRADMYGERFDLHALAGLLDEDWVVGDLGCGTGQIAVALDSTGTNLYVVEGGNALSRILEDQDGDRYEVVGIIDEISVRR